MFKCGPDLSWAECVPSCSRTCRVGSGALQSQLHICEVHAVSSRCRWRQNPFPSRGGIWAEVPGPSPEPGWWLPAPKRLHSEEVARACCPSPTSIAEHGTNLERLLHPSRGKELLLEESAPFSGNLAVSMKWCCFLLYSHGPHSGFQTLVLALLKRKISAQHS